MGESEEEGEIYRIGECNIRESPGWGREVRGSIGVAYEEGWDAWRPGGSANVQTG